MFGGLAVVAVGVADGSLVGVDPAGWGGPGQAVEHLQRPGSGVHVGVVPAADEGQVGDVGGASGGPPVEVVGVGLPSDLRTPSQWS